MIIDWKVLQNGSDIRGVALPLIDNESVNLDEKVSEILGASFITWLSESEEIPPGELVIGIGMDSRISGPKLRDAFIHGAVNKGCNVLDFGIATTPAMFMSTQLKSTKCHGSVMLTASHLPPNRNGMKFFTQKSGLEKKDITRILEIAANNAPKQVTDNVGQVHKADILTPYSQFLVDYIRKHSGSEKPLSGLKIIVDAGNGAGGFFAERILVPLGADTKGSQFLEPDGNFPNHIPNPEDKDAMNSIIKAVINNQADLGIIFDTDVDRSAIVDNTGRPINRNALIALLSAIILEEHPNSYIVTDSVTSEGLSKFISHLGGKHHRFKRGYRNVINESIKLNKEDKECWLAIETSGHGAMKENFNLDDGAYMVAKILVKVAQLKNENEKITSLISNLEEPQDSAEFRIGINNDEFKEYGNMIISELKGYVNEIEGWEPEKVNFEGVRINCRQPNGNGWFLLRLSLHDPVLPLNIESDEKGGVEAIARQLRPFFLKFDQLNNISLT